MASYTNPKSGLTIPVFVHGFDFRNGAQFAVVNKGEAKSPYVFAVKVEDTNLVLA